jgi:hypothetical protein
MRGTVIARDTNEAAYSITYTITLDGGPKFDIPKRDYDRVFLGMTVYISYYPHSRLVTDIAIDESGSLNRPSGHMPADANQHLQTDI